MYMYIYIYIDIHIHTHIHTHIYIYITAMDPGIFCSTAFEILHKILEYNELLG
jgi:hypothetical protein